MALWPLSLKQAVPSFEPKRTSGRSQSARFSRLQLCQHECFHPGTCAALSHMRAHTHTHTLRSFFDDRNKAQAFGFFGFNRWGTDSRLTDDVNLCHLRVLVHLLPPFIEGAREVPCRDLELIQRDIDVIVPVALGTCTPCCCLQVISCETSVNQDVDRTPAHDQ